MLEVRSTGPGSVCRMEPQVQDLASFGPSLIQEGEDYLSLPPQIQVWAQPPPQRQRAVVLTGRHLVSDTEVQLYQRVLQQMDYEVQLSRYAESSGFLRTNHGNSPGCDLRGTFW